MEPTANPFDYFTWHPASAEVYDHIHEDEYEDYTEEEWKLEEQTYTKANKQ